jgi:hypothetical protein
MVFREPAAQGNARELACPASVRVPGDNRLARPSSAANGRGDSRDVRRPPTSQSAAMGEPARHRPQSRPLDPGELQVLKHALAEKRGGLAGGEGPILSQWN